MKRIIVICLLLFCFHVGRGQNMAEFVISKPFCVLNFLETMIGGKGTSTTLKQYVNERIPATDTAFSKLVADYSRISQYYFYELPEFPGSRRSSVRTTAHLIKIAAIQATSIQQFRIRISGILSNKEQTELCDILTRAEPYYNCIIWDVYAGKARTQLNELAKYESRISEAFRKVRKVYGASWSDDMPFRIAMYFIPGRSGHSTASPYANSLCIGMFTEEENHIKCIGVTLHEMCHVLYDEQPAMLQHQLDSFFRENKSPYSRFTYDYFDEGMATALGNGWADKYLSGSIDTGLWYNNEYIDGFGHALYPLASRYANEGKTIDKAFVDSAIQLFARTFPRSHTDYSVLLNRVSIYANAEDAAERQKLFNTIGSHFRFSFADMTTPVGDTSILQDLRQDPAAQLVIIDRDHVASLRNVQKAFPNIAGLTNRKTDKNYILSFFDQQKRPVIIIRVENPNRLNDALGYLEKQKYIEPNRAYLPIK